MTARAETRVAIAEAKVEILDRMVARIDGLTQRIVTGVAAHADAAETLRALPSLTTTRQ